MKFYDYIYCNYGYDLSYFDKYIIRGSVGEGIILIRYDETDVADVLERSYKAFINSHKLSFEEYCERYRVLGCDGFSYKCSDGKFIKTSDWIPFKFFLYYLITMSRHKSIAKNDIHFKQRCSQFGESAVIKKVSVLPYKAYEFFSREHKITFNYRLKKANEANKPLVIYMSGAGCLGYDNFKQMYECHKELSGQLKNHDCSVLIPQAPWGANMDMSLSSRYIDAVIKLLDRVSDDVEADRKRIYLLGTSFGGMCTWEMIYRYPHIFACGMPVMGNILYGKDREDFEFERFLKTPLWVAHSSDDDNVKIDSDDYCVEELKKIGADVRYTRWDKYGHKMSSKFYKNEPWAEWMFSQVKK